MAKQPKALQRFVGNPRLNLPDGLPLRLTHYMELVDWTGRQIREDKRSSIDDELPCILTRLDIDDERWLYMTQNFESSFKTHVGVVPSLRKFTAILKRLKLFSRTIPQKYKMEITAAAALFWGMRGISPFVEPDNSLVLIEFDPFRKSGYLPFRKYHG